MKYVVVKSRKDNFGDDLNGWLWPQLFEDLDNDEDCYFLGIGTILLHGSEVLSKIKGSKKIVFGSGYRPSEHYLAYRPDDCTEIKFLRGPLSALCLGSRYEYITDAAYAIRQLKNFEQLKNTKKKYAVSLMPYFLSTDFFNWEKLCEQLGFHYISPLSEKGVAFTLEEIAASGCLITEAMHGAVAADLLRVPWHRFILSTPHTEGQMISEFKWADWLQSIHLFNPETTFVPFYKRTRLHNWVKRLTGNMVSTEYFYKPYVKRQLLEKLSGISSYHLSEDSLLAGIDVKIAEKIRQVRAEH